MVIEVITDSSNFLLVKNLDSILQNNNLTKNQIVEKLRNLRDELDRFY